MFLRLVACTLVISLTTSGLAGETNANSSSKELPRQISAALKSAFPDTPAARREQAQMLLKLYAATSEMPAADRTRWQLRLKSRLVRLADAIGKDSADRASSSSVDAKSNSATSTGTDDSHQPTGAAGGGPQDDGQALVELIQATIAPQSWDVNGGAGTIQYWPAWHVLVVRQTDDVHERIGGAVHALRK
jgi:hypothetical protein